MKCKNCGKKFSEKYSKWSNGDFCSKSCGNSFSRKQSKQGTKLVHCITCQKEIEVDKRASDKLCKCDECKKEKCNICGEYICKRKDICKKFRIFPALIKYFGFDEKKIGTINIYEEFDRIKNMLIEDYVENNFSTLDLSKKYNHNHFGNFNKILDTLDIKKRNLKDASLISFLNGNHKINSSPKYQQGWYTTWNNKQVFYRSSYELDYAMELDEKKIDYEMEKLRLLYWDSRLLRQRIAIPDFYLPKTNEIVEIKSDWTYDEQNMKDKVKSYKEHGYKFRLILEHENIQL